MRICRLCGIKKTRCEFPGRDRKYRTCNDCGQTIKDDREKRIAAAFSEGNKDHRLRRYYKVALGLAVRRSQKEIIIDSLRKRVEEKAQARGQRLFRKSLRIAEEIYQHSDPEAIKERRKDSRAKYRLDPARERRKSKARYHANIEAERLRVTLYKHSHPDKVAKWGDKRKRLAAEQSDGSLSHPVVGKLFAAAKRCPYCERKLTAQNKTLDHLVALSRGGSHGIHNTLICCRDCNIRKNAMPFAGWCSTLSESCERRARKIYRQRYKAEPEQQTMPLKYA